jgi:cobalt-zinc-cadmium efflux system membrane fusion protein
MGITVVGFVLLLGGVWAVSTWWKGEWRGPGSSEEAEAVMAGAGAEPTRVRLTDLKRTAAGIQVAPAARRDFQRMHLVAGRLQYDDTRHVEIKAAADGTIQEFLVKPGDRVVRGQTLAVLSCPAVGLVRADVFQRQAELELAERELAWRRETNRNLQELVGEVERRRAVDEIEKQFRGRPLGGFRESLLAAYARFQLAETLLANVHTAKDSGAMALRTLRERTAERQTAEAALRSACEQTAFDSHQQCQLAESAVQDAIRRLEVARQQLTTLLGYDDHDDEPRALAGAESRGDTTAALSLVESRAAFAGTIESKRFSVSERVARGDTLLVLADTTRLWVVADLRERDWPALQLQPAQELSIEVPAVPGRVLAARLHYVGREVSPESNAIPLVAFVDNPDGDLRPGLYARVSVPLSKTRESLAVPAAALIEHEGQSFVFEEVSPNEFLRRDVQTGERTDAWVEIRDGLADAAPVVVQGAFYLKSELLLEREE